MMFELLDGWGDTNDNLHLWTLYGINDPIRKVSIYSPIIKGTIPNLQWKYNVNVRDHDGNFISPEDWVLMEPYVVNPIFEHTQPMIDSNDIPKPPDNWRDQVKIFVISHLSATLRCCKADLIEFKRRADAAKTEYKFVKEALKLFDKVKTR